MALLDLRDVAFAQGGRTLLKPFSLTLEPGERHTASFASPVEAAIAARIAAGIVRATSGAAFINGFDPRIQPVQAKRSVGYISAALFDAPFANSDAYLRYRAVLWNVDADAVRRAGDLARDPDLARWDASVADALLGDPPLIVIENLDDEIADALHRLRADITILRTATR